MLTAAKNRGSVQLSFARSVRRNPASCMQSITVWCGITKAARIVIMNAEPTQFDDIADEKLSGLIGEDLPRICGRFDAA